MDVDIASAFFADRASARLPVAGEGKGRTRRADGFAEASADMQNAIETAYTYYGSPVRRALLQGRLAASILRNPAVFPSAATLASFRIVLDEAPVLERKFAGTRTTIESERDCAASDSIASARWPSSML